MDCPECKRLRQAYADATLRNVELCQIANDAGLAEWREICGEAALARSMEWNEARKAFYKHLRSHDGVTPESADME